MKIAVCPNSIEHKKFSTSAHVMQDWIVDESGDFLEVEDECVQIDNGPDRDNIWSCIDCGAEAEHIYDEDIDEYHANKNENSTDNN